MAGRLGGPQFEVFDGGAQDGKTDAVGSAPLRPVLEAEADRATPIFREDPLGISNVAIQNRRRAVLDAPSLELLERLRPAILESSPVEGEVAGLGRASLHLFAEDRGFYMRIYPAHYGPRFMYEILILTGTRQVEWRLANWMEIETDTNSGSDCEGCHGSGCTSYADLATNVMHDGQTFRREVSYPVPPEICLYDVMSSFRQSL
jgi:hypothetical protein